MAEIQVGEGHNGGSISARAGDTLVIRLPENPTTGFRWGAAGMDSALLRLQSDDFAPGAGGVGGAGMRIFRYLATGSGETSIGFQLARSWEAAAPRSQFTIRVSIAP